MAARGSTIGGEACQLTAGRHAARYCTPRSRLDAHVCERHPRQREVRARCMLAALVGLAIYEARLHEYEALVPGGSPGCGLLPVCSFAHLGHRDLSFRSAGSRAGVACP